MKRLLSSIIAVGVCAWPSLAADPIKVLIVDGQNNHSWKTTTPILKSILEDTKRFKVDVATSPSKPGGPATKPKDPESTKALKIYEESLVL